MNNFISLHHVSILVSDTARSLKFYHEIMQMEPAPRADLPFPGAWLSVGEQQIHLLELPNPDPVTGRPLHGGRDRHVALQVRSLKPIIAALEKASIDYSMSRSGRAALFCRDPDGNALEIIENPRL